MSWRWNARRLGISVFLIVHVAATTIWVVPPCPLKQRGFLPAAYYIYPLGLWQSWAMFAPDPVHDTITLEADVIDSRGLRYSFAFPRLSDYSVLGGIPRFRYSKYTANLGSDDFELVRKFAARHAVRRLNVPADAYPVDVHILFQVRPTPPPGQPPADSMTPTKPLEIGSYAFNSPAEVRP